MAKRILSQKQMKSVSGGIGATKEPKAMEFDTETNPGEMIRKDKLGLSPAASPAVVSSPSIVPTKLTKVTKPK